MIHHIKIRDVNLHKLIKQKEVGFGGNINLKIYGTLHCKWGKRMKRENRVFFLSETEGYKKWFPALRKLYESRISKMEKWSCLAKK